MNRNLTSKAPFTGSVREWERLLAKHFVPGRVDLKTAGPGGQLEPPIQRNRLWLAQLSVPPQSIVHTNPHLRSIPAEERASIIAHVMIEGSGFIEQGGIRLPFGAGDISFRTLSAPSCVSFQTASRFLAVRLPAAIMYAPRPNRHPINPKVAAGTHPSTEAIHGLLSGIRWGCPTNSADYCLSFALPWLFAASYHGDEDIDAPNHRSDNERRWQQILQHIEQNALETDDMSARTCAQAVGISESYLHRLFAQRGLRFSKTVLEQRLGAAHALIQSQIHTTHSIASIAYQCGFKDPGHFSRLFKQRYGMPPRQYQIHSSKNRAFDKGACAQQKPHHELDKPP